MFTYPTVLVVVSLVVLLAVVASAAAVVFVIIGTWSDFPAVNNDMCIQMNTPPPAYSTSSLSRGYHSISPPIANRQISTPPSVTPTARSRGRYSLPASSMTLPLTSWETFSDSDPPRQPSPSCDVARQSPLATAAAASACDVVKEKPADTEAPVSPNDVSFSHSYILIKTDLCHIFQLVSTVCRCILVFPFFLNCESETYYICKYLQ